MNVHGGDIYGYDRPLTDFSANINPLGVPESFKQALRENVDAFALYPEPTYRALKRQVAAYLETNPEWVILGNGAVDLIYRVIEAAAQDRVYTLAPTFSEYRQAATLQNRDYYEMPVFQADYTGIDIERMLNLIQPDSTVVLCNPNNPTGTLASRETLSQVAGALAEHNCHLIVDEAFIEFTDCSAAQTLLRMVERYPNLLVIRAATKFFGMPGLRLGYGITANQIWRERIQTLGQPWQINTAAVIAAAVVFNDWEYIQSSQAWISEERSYFYNRLTGVPNLHVYPSQANFYLVKLLRAGLDAYQLQERLLNRGILIRTPRGFSGLTPYHFRVAVKDRGSNDLLVAGLHAICES
jgi:threonine-phosphate decarboxylase